jgi:hypothetical protein
MRQKENSELGALDPAIHRIYLGGDKLKDG